jgi:hypothetical protein
MTKIVLSHEDYERVLREGLDLDAYLQGRFDEAASDVKYLNEEVDVTVPINLNGERLGEAMTKSSLPVQRSEGSEIKKFHEDCHKAFTEAAYPATSVTCESGRTYTVRDVVVFPETDDGEDVAIIVQVDSGDDGFPARVYWEERRFAEWLSDDDFEGSFKIN